jgi:hypothetical protein
MLSSNGKVLRMRRRNTVVLKIRVLAELGMEWTSTVKMRAEVEFYTEPV